MRLGGSRAVIYPTEEGQVVLRRAGIVHKEGASLDGSIAEADETGLWIEVLRGVDSHLFLLRWEFVIGLELKAKDSRTGFKD